jgi:2-polyprenyl-6-methoxyphenol hydroxylase-like FAD-dependent oxidoreductase
MAAARKAIIVGGSVGGLSAGLALRQRGWDVVVLERATEPLSARGAGIVTHPQLLAGLRELGVPADTSFGVRVQRRVMLDRSGNVIGAHAFEQIMAAWDRLHHALMVTFGAVGYRSGAALVGIDRADQKKPVAVLQSGDRLAADLIIGADGFRSTVRSLIWPHVKPTYAHYVAWRGLIDEAAFSPDVQRDFFPLFAFFLPPGEQILGYPVAGPGNDLQPGHRRYVLVWYRPTSPAALDDMLTDAQGRHHQMSIPPPLIRQSVVDAMRGDAIRLLPKPFADVVALTAVPYVQPMYDLAVDQMVLDRCLLLGDAAFVARPHIGAGVTKAVRDALALAGHLDVTDDIDAGLRYFERDRLIEGKLMTDRGQWLGDAIHRAAPSSAVMLAETANLSTLIRD